MTSSTSVALARAQASMRRRPEINCGLFEPCVQRISFLCDLCETSTVRLESFISFLELPFSEAGINDGKEKQKVA